MIYITCPQCDTEHELAPEAAGSCITCGHCGRNLEIGALEEEAPEEPELAPLEPTEPEPWLSTNAATVLMNEAEPLELVPEPPAPPKREKPKVKKAEEAPRARGNARTLRPGKLPSGSPKQTIKASPGKAAARKAEVDEGEDAEKDWRGQADRPRWLGPVIVGVFVVALVAFGSTGGYYLLRASREKETPDASVAPKPQLTIPAPPSSKDKAAPTKSPPTTTPSVTSGREIYQELLKSTVWISVRLEKGRAFGSGVLVDRTNRLVLTNNHVVDRSLEVLVYFPMVEQGKVVVDRKQYQDKIKPADQITGRVIARDAKRDLALLQVSRLPETVQAVAVASRSASPGDPVHSIGNPGSSDSLWVYTSGTVRQVYHKKWRAGDGAGTTHELDADVVETQSPTNPGDSGGPLVNSSGELVGITQGGDLRGQLMSLFVDVNEITRFVEISCKTNNLSWARGRFRPSITGGNVLDLVKELENPDALTRGKAAQALGEAGPLAKVAVPALLKGLKDSDSLFRKLALEALDKIGAPDKSDIDLLRESVKDESVTVRSYAAEALGRMGPDARPAATELAALVKSDPSPSVRLQAARALGRIGARAKQVAFPALVAALPDGDQGVRTAAAEAITALGPLAEADRPAVLDMLKHEDLDVRIFGVQAVAQLAGQGKSVVPTLIELARPENEARLRRAALVSMRAFGKDAKGAVSLLSAIVKDESPELRQAAGGVLLQLGAEARPAVPALADGLAGTDSPTRALFLEILEKLGPEAGAAVPALKKLLASKEKDDIVNALAVLAAMGKDAKDAVPSIVVLFEGADSAVLDKAVETLGKIGKPALPYLVSGMRDRNTNVRLAAVRAVGLIGPDARAAAQPLAILGQSDPAATVRAEAVDAFRKVMSGPATPPKKK